MKKMRKLDEFDEFDRWTWAVTGWRLARPRDPRISTEKEKSASANEVDAGEQYQTPAKSTHLASYSTCHFPRTTPKAK